MNTRLSFCTIVMLAASAVPAIGQVIKGEVVDKDSKHVIDGVTIENIHTSLSVNTSENGSFVIAATGDQLLEFKKTGYQTVRVRIPKGMVPPYFKIIMQHGVTHVKDLLAANTGRYDYTQDSIRFYELYKHELDMPKLSAIGSISHPFSALSKKNREVWQFQNNFSETEKEKYVDRTFNAELITRYTGLTGDSLAYYMVKFRPSYEDLRGMNDYTFFNYIKRTAYTYRNHSRGRSAQ